MRALVESLKRLYSKNKIAAEKISQMAAENKITDEEKTYIMY